MTREEGAVTIRALRRAARAVMVVSLILTLWCLIAWPGKDNVAWRALYFLCVAPMAITYLMVVRRDRVDAGIFRRIVRVHQAAACLMIAESAVLLAIHAMWWFLPGLIGSGALFSTLVYTVLWEKIRPMIEGEGKGQTPSGR